MKIIKQTKKGQSTIGFKFIKIVNRLKRRVFFVCLFFVRGFELVLWGRFESLYSHNNLMDTSYLYTAPFLGNFV